MRTFEDFQSNGKNFWLKELIDLEKSTSIIPLLIDTQDKFISLLNISDKNPTVWKETLKNTTSLSANLFLKHLMVLSDIGGEKLMRFKTELPNMLKNNTIEFTWNSKNYEYQFKSLADSKSWNNKNLGVDGDSLITAVEINDLIEDVAMLLLFGGSALDVELPEEILDKCIIGNLLGESEELETFVRQRYIWVSRITGGATANSMGQLAQNFVIDYLKSHLPKWNFDRKDIPSISQNDGRTPMKFDIVAKSPKEKYCAIEVSFQVTTNSTIERKAGQAQARQMRLNKAGHSIAYVIDGAGNFERKSAISTILQFSDCSVTFNEFDKLKLFLESLEK
jgi:hypothetical protein